MSKPQVTKTAAQLFVECLENEGVEFIFGLPGEENAEFAMALQASSIKFILVRHESGAAFMADTYGRLTGRPGVCFATLGPGATNLLTGVANGNMDRAPLVAITGQGELGRLHRESHQVIDVVALFKPLVKWGVSIFKASVVPEVVYKAFKVALTEKPGAVHIELPEDVASFEAGDLKPIKHLDKVRRSVPDDKAIDQIWDMLKDAKKPVILAGNGVLRHHATGQLTEFVDATKIPVVNTFMAKGAIARSHPAALFTVGLSSGDFNNQVLEGSDLVLAIGYDVVEYHPKLWNPDSDLRIAHIDFAPAEVDTHYRTAAEAVGDLSHSLWMLNERVKEEPIEVDPSYYADIRQTMLDDFAFHAADDQQGSIKPQKMLWDLRETLGPKDIAISDVGAHKMWFSRYYQADEPLTAIVHNGFCSMGGALPGAIAAKLAFPDRTVVALAGDGAFLQNVQEMETARRIGTNIIVVVWVDGGYGLISWKQDNRWNKHSDLSFGNPDFDALAQAFDWAHFACDDSTKLAGVLQDAVAATAERPVLVSIPIDYAENPKLTERLGSLRCRE